ncbi:MAG: hypothetical protein IPK83_19260 [Planctomycetes bacterium]|nr:hypothetical protein [Planctomycetota bacterium]
MTSHQSPEPRMETVCPSSQTGEAPSAREAASRRPVQGVVVKSDVVLTGRLPHP